MAKAIERWLSQRAVRAVVASAARGADLLALRAATALGIRIRVVLSCARSRFRDRSVVDQGGSWGAIFDELVDQAHARGDLVVLPGDALTPDSLAATNQRLIFETLELAGHLSATPGALAVWSGKARAAGFDATADFVARVNRLQWACETLDVTGHHEP
jgi:hypothetical protein